MQKKNVLVIGGGTGIGKAIAILFAKSGSAVAVAGRRMDVLESVVGKTDSEIPMKAHTVDVVQRDNVKNLIDWALSELGTIDVLVNCAGTNIKNRTMLEMRPEQFDELMAINATGAYNSMWAILPHMRERNDGLIVNVTSIAGKRAAALGGIAYVAAKFAATGLGTAVANEELHRGVRVTNVYPGEVETPILENRPTPVTDEHRARILQPEDIAPLILTIANLPPRAHVPEIVIKPTLQEYF